MKAFLAILFISICFCGFAQEEQSQEGIDRFGRKAAKYLKKGKEKKILKLFMSKKDMIWLAESIQEGLSEKYNSDSVYQHYYQTKIRTVDVMLEMGTKDSINWKETTFNSIIYEQKKIEGVAIEAANFELFLNYKGQRYLVYIDNCYKTSKGWKVVDYLFWKGVKD